MIHLRLKKKQGKKAMVLSPSDNLVWSQIEFLEHVWSVPSGCHYTSFPCPSTPAADSVSERVISKPKVMALGQGTELEGHMCSSLPDEFM